MILALAVSCNKTSPAPEKDKNKNKAKAATSTSAPPIPVIQRPAGDEKFAQVRIRRSPPVAKKYKEQADLMFHVMAAEISMRRRDLKSAVQHYMEAVKLSSDVNLVKRASRIALYAKNIDAGILASKRWAELEPQKSEPHRYLAILYLRKKDLDASVTELNKYHSLLRTPNKMAFPMIVTLLRQEPDKESAFEVMRRFYQQYKDDPYALYAISLFAMHVKKYEQASSYIDAAIRKKPDWADALLLRARLLVLQKKKHKAINDMRRLVKARPDSRQMRISYARLLTEARQYEKAQKQFKILLQKKPDDTNVIYALALLSLEMKDYIAADRYFKKMLKVDSRRLEAQYYLGIIAEKRKRYDTAIARLSKVRHGDRSIDAHLRIATIMGRKGDVEAARRFLYQLKPRTRQLEVQLFLTEADILHNANRTKDGMEVIQNALETNKDNPKLLYAHAMLAEKLGRLDIVERDLKKILAKYPRHAQALNALGYTLADRTDRFQEAYRYIKKALELSPNQAAIIDSMGWVLYRLGNYKEAIKYLRRALELDKNAEIAAHLGEVLWVSGQKEEARKIWLRAKRMDKNNEVLKATLKRFKQ